MARYLGYQASHWNKIAEDAQSRRHVEAYLTRRLQREWIAKLSGTQFKVYSFVLSRTLGWQKYAEAIPIRHFIEGLLEADGSVYRDDKSPFRISCVTSQSSDEHHG